jgi:hypothetical protein
MHVVTAAVRMIITRIRFLSLFRTPPLHLLSKTTYQYYPANSYIIIILLAETTTPLATMRLHSLVLLAAVIAAVRGVDLHAKSQG